MDDRQKIAIMYNRQTSTFFSAESTQSNCDFIR